VDEPNNVIEELDLNGKRKKKKKKVKMDPQTQKSLTAIHKHLMEDDRVKERFMMTSSQLTNDRKVRKDCEKEATRSSSSRRPQQASGEARSKSADDKKERGKPPSKTGRAVEAESHSTNP